MRIVGVLDLAAGRAVHAVAGDRNHYAPVTSVAGTPIDLGDPLAVARAYLDRLGLSELYVADLDAIVSGGSQAALVAGVASLGARVWLDAGVKSQRRRGTPAVRRGNGRGGLETLLSHLAPRRSAEVGWGRGAQPDTWQRQPVSG